MTLTRYSGDSRIVGGTQFGSPRSILAVKNAIKNGIIPIVHTLTLTGDDRLDTLAGTYYGDSRYWWVIAAASGIGWGLQIPPGTVINIVRLSDVKNIIG